MNSNGKHIEFADLGFQVVFIDNFAPKIFNSSPLQICDGMKNVY